MPKARKARAKKKDIVKEEPEEQLSDEGEEDDTQYIDLDVKLHLPTDEDEMVPSMKVPVLMNGNIDFPLLMTKLKAMGYPLESAFAYYKSNDLDLYVSCGHDPLPKF